jgi:hypothetical protein
MKLRWRWQALMLEAQRSVLPTRNLYKSAAEHLSFAYEQVGGYSARRCSPLLRLRLSTGTATFRQQ